MELEKYRDYLVSHWLPEDEDIYALRDIKAKGWHMLMDEVLSPLIAKELGMRYLGNCIWADDYSKHRRRVLSLFLLNDDGGVFKWGWNFDFVPKMSGVNAVYARTDKMIFTHIFENAELNHDSSISKSPDMFFSRCNIDSSDFENSMRAKVGELTDAFYVTLPLICAFYKETSTYEQTIEMIDILSESLYYRMLEGNGLKITKIFLQQYLGWGEDNEKELRNLLNNDKQRENFYKKFNQIPMKE